MANNKTKVPKKISEINTSSKSIISKKNKPFAISMITISDKEIQSFRKKVLDFYTENKRSYPWRETTDPYKILVSEIMLQQTQTNRAVEKYLEFTEKFPDFERLANAPLSEVLIAWQGLGYNRRAKMLHACAKVIVTDYQGVFPQERQELLKLPGIGAYTSGSILAFAFNKPLALIDTNVRTVFIYEFFKDAENVSDKDILPIVERACPKDNACVWYNAVFDYGTMIKKEVGNITKKSNHYQKQSKFKGSKREVRGKVLTHLAKNKTATKNNLYESINDTRLPDVLCDLEKEGFIEEKKGMYVLKD